MGFGSFYKGEKKKPKKGEAGKKQGTTTAVFTVPQVTIIAKGKNKYK
jgi:hypothetical protein